VSDRRSLLLGDVGALCAESRLVHSGDRNVDGETTRDRRQILGVLESRRRLNQLVLFLAVFAKQWNCVIHLLHQFQLTETAKLFEPLPQMLAIFSRGRRPHVLNCSKDSLVQMMIVVHAQEPFLR
jgi:hypothetical protein